MTCANCCHMALLKIYRAHQPDLSQEPFRSKVVRLRYPLVLGTSDPDTRKAPRTALFPNFVYVGMQTIVCIITNPFIRKEQSIWYLQAIRYILFCQGLCPEIQEQCTAKRAGLS